jgi:hypothetical protein
MLVSPYFSLVAGTSIPSLVAGTSISSLVAGTSISSPGNGKAASVVRFRVLYTYVLLTITASSVL